MTGPEQKALLERAVAQLGLARVREIYQLLVVENLGPSLLRGLNRAAMTAIEAVARELGDAATP